MKPSFVFLLVAALLENGSSVSIPHVPEDEEAVRQARIAHENSLKYFHEPGGHEAGDDELLGHYDTRFFKEKLKYGDKREVQLHMMRAYLDTLREEGVETWIAHGTLLGWWWNGGMLPWDWDIDTQVSEATLFWLGRNMNGTRTTYSGNIDGHNVTATYLMDVNPYGAERERGNGMNIIDARWINVENGLYIDITGLSELKPVEEPGVISCKNNHHYALGEIYPLRTTRFEGVEAVVPYEYTKLLKDEYGEKALTLTEFQGHRWNQNEKAWKPIPDSEHQRPLG